MINETADTKSARRRFGRTDVIFESIHDVMTHYDASDLDALSLSLDEEIPTTNRFEALVVDEVDMICLVLGTVGIEMQFPMSHDDLMHLALELEEQIEALEARAKLSEKMRDIVHLVPNYAGFTDDEIYDELMKDPPRSVTELIEIGEELALRAVGSDLGDLTADEIAARIAQWRADSRA